MSQLIAAQSVLAQMTPVVYQGITLQQYSRVVAEQKGVSPDLLTAVINCESQWNPDAVGKAGEIGLVQIILKYHTDVTEKEARDPYFSVNYLAYNIQNGNGKWWSCYKKEAPLYLPGVS